MGKSKKFRHVFPRKGKAFMYSQFQKGAWDPDPSIASDRDAVSSYYAEMQNCPDCVHSCLNFGTEETPDWISQEQFVDHYAKKAKDYLLDNPSSRKGTNEEQDPDDYGADVSADLIGGLNLGDPPGVKDDGGAISPIVIVSEPWLSKSGEEYRRRVRVKVIPPSGWSTSDEDKKAFFEVQGSKLNITMTATSFISNLLLTDVFGGTYGETDGNIHPAQVAYETAREELSETNTFEVSLPFDARVVEVDGVLRADGDELVSPLSVLFVSGQKSGEPCGACMVDLEEVGGATPVDSYETADDMITTSAFKPPKPPSSSDDGTFHTSGFSRGTRDNAKTSNSGDASFDGMDESVEGEEVKDDDEEDAEEGSNEEEKEVDDLEAVKMLMQSEAFLKFLAEKISENSGEAKQAAADAKRAAECARNAQEASWKGSSKAWEAASNCDNAADNFVRLIAGNEDVLTRISSLITPQLSKSSDFADLLSQMITNDPRLNEMLVKLAKGFTEDFNKKLVAVMKEVDEIKILLNNIDPSDEGLLKSLVHGVSKVAQLESKLNEAVENFSTSREAAMDDSGLADVVEQLKTEMKSHEETLRELQTGMATFKIPQAEAAKITSFVDTMKHISPQWIQQATEVIRRAENIVNSANGCTDLPRKRRPMPDVVH